MTPIEFLILGLIIGLGISAVQVSLVALVIQIRNRRHRRNTFPLRNR